MVTKVKKKLNKREFLESTEYSNSWYHLHDDGYGISLTLADCNRQITWNFGDLKSPADIRRGRKKIKKIKKVIDELYAYLHDE